LYISLVRFKKIKDMTWKYREMGSRDKKTGKLKYYNVLSLIGRLQIVVVKQECLEDSHHVNI